MTDRKQELREIITSGRDVTVTEDEEMFALLPSEEYEQLDRSRVGVTNVMHILVLPALDIPTITDHWCVYTNAIDGQDFYIGVCRYSQLLEFPDARNNNIWLQMVKANPSVSTTVLFTGIDRDACISFRNIYQVTNRYHANETGITTDNTKRSTVRCVTDGCEFPSIAAAARHYNISATMISNHLNGRAGYKHVKSLTFERITP